LCVSVQVDLAKNEECKLLGLFQYVGEPPALQLLDQAVDLNDTNFLTAKPTGFHSSNEISFAFHPCRKWKYIPKQRCGDHLFSVYFIVNGKVRGIAESTVFGLVSASSKIPRYHSDFHAVTRPRGHTGETNTKRSKRSDSNGTMKGNKTRSAVPVHEQPLIDLFRLSWNVDSYDDKLHSYDLDYDVIQ